eukprot:CAMPEP_0170623476 /NCGR_PEP_ID=MMETSP0224-20130122/29721_1 /TAXON_ID=285029 /ORGANISM="Togula jolla, Strain CCCM 725" /LENGTH=41 /DNA_ID= /DNA_START= /DNA_END= /DNA_ORIENTATION=
MDATARPKAAALAAASPFAAPPLRAAFDSKGAATKLIDAAA